MSNGKKDQNETTVSLAASTVDGSPTPLTVDPITGRLLIAITGINEFPTTNPGLKIDQNNTPVSFAYNEDTDEIMPLLTDPNNIGNLLCDVLVE